MAAANAAGESASRMCSSWARSRPLGAESGGDDGAADGEGLHDFQTGAAADAQRDDLEMGGLVMRADVVHLAGDGDAGERAVGADGRDGVAADDLHAS